ncbi:large subunit ribosomal protein L25 [Chitinophaga terrae (ex Kim and Jung 2007)]|uniref:Large ribosomal subunit protein bL25 n=1 Tax=Chitinophaga terrae (ex Kim and Jung 2007) TaxID=408074 RepID=A0A1H4FJS2_9BACT|nr:50S ribosomal protein L25 [Chitinophaga terrae (ex Kim and Jung 2007)]MDQ0105890.1 large subunit ribosomal protein L25 [Chitinophaga terrae (ex Kim and Jung 2007)]GEP92449.1 50S ribosomal protein L25 [Chitinophaga terrae (ex Kim and Jung 2007)]SEA97554.1 large subunit ribosomal protein L25 [Chitinophaga terrae (ex Kim and Jung 2007)]
MKTITIEGQLRSEFGKKATRQLRSEDKVPCVIYGGAETVNFSAPSKSFKALVYTADFQLAEIKLGSKSYKCVLKDMQFDVVTDELTHVDFLELVEDKTVNVTLPIKLVGQSAGVKAGGKLVSKMKALKVKALPKNLVENIEVNIENLELNGNIRVEDVKIEGIEITNSPRIPIASVVMTRQLRQEEASAEKDAKKK